MTRRARLNPAAQHADRDPQHPAVPALRAQARDEIAARRDGRVEQVDHPGRLVEMRRAPRDRLGASPDVAHRNRQARAAQAQVPPAEQTPAHQARQRRLVPVHERSGPDDAGRDPERRRFALDQLLLQTLAPGVRRQGAAGSSGRGVRSSWRSHGVRGGRSTERLLTSTSRRTPAACIACSRCRVASIVLR